MLTPIGIGVRDSVAGTPNERSVSYVRSRLPTRKRFSGLYQDMKIDDSDKAALKRKDSKRRQTRGSVFSALFGSGSSAIAPDERKTETVAPAETETFDAVLFGMIDTQNNGRVDILEILNFFDAHRVLTKGDVNILSEFADEQKTQGSLSLDRDQFKRLILRMDIATANDTLEELVRRTSDNGDDDEKGESKRERPSPKWMYGDGSFMGRANAHGRNGSVVMGAPIVDTDILPWYIIAPSSPHRLGWDVVILVLLVYTMIVTPLRLGFDLEAEVLGFWFWLESLIDCLFVADVVVNFLTSYTDEETGKMVSNLCSIANAYVRSWFLLDVVSSIPFDLISYASNGDASEDYGLTSGAKTLKTGRVIKVMRIFKLSKLLRLARAVKVGQRLEEHLDLVGRAPVKIFKIVFATLFMSHIFACGWAGMARVNGERAYMTNSWVSMWGVTTTGFTTEYLSALYWSVTTLTTVGYGDISPQDNAEMVFAAFAMIAGGAFYGYIIAKLAALMQGLDANARVYHERMDAIVSYMRQRNFPRHLFGRVSRYYKHYFQRKTALDESAILDGLSDALQLDVSKYLAHDTFDRSYLFHKISDGVLMRLMNLVVPIKSTPDEVIFQMGDPGKELYILTLGNVFAFDRNGDVLLEYGSGAVFGEFAPLGLIGGRLFHAQCRNMCEFGSIQKSALEDACYEYPGAFERLAEKAKSALDRVVRRLGLLRRSMVLKALQRRKTKAPSPRNQDDAEEKTIVSRTNESEADRGELRARVATMAARLEAVAEAQEAMRRDLATLVARSATKVSE